MSAPPGRLALVPDRVGFAAIGAASAGVFDSLAGLESSRLGVTTPGALALIAVGGLTGALVGIGPGLALSLVPPRPRGRSRWAAFLVGIVAVVAVECFIVLFTDPPPFQDPPPFHGSVAAWLGVCAVGAVCALGLYQIVRGAGNVAAATIALCAAGGAWSWSGAAPLPAPALAPPAGAPNILLVTLDTTRADRVGAYGNDVIDTPNFDRLAKEGVLFRNASAVAAVTGPSHTAMLTGTGPWENGVLLNGIPIPPEQRLVSEVLHDAGWHTGAFVSAYILDGKLGFSRGFEVYDDDFGWFPGLTTLLVPRAIDMAHRHENPDWVLERRGADTVDRALRWIQRQDGPYFAWVHLFDAHGPYEPPPPFDTRYYEGDPRDPSLHSMEQVKGVASYLLPSLRGITDLSYVLAQYDGEVSYADSQLGRLLDAVGEDTLVLVMGDHGEGLGEHGVWFNHGDDVYETSVHVPFALRWKGKVQPKEIVDPVQGNDLAPTLLARVGIPAPAMTGVDALSVPRAMAASMAFDRETNLSERAAGRITKPKWRLAAERGPTSRWIHREVDGRGEYFDLATDPAGLVDQFPQRAADPAQVPLFDALRAATTRLFEGDTSHSAQELSAEEREKLKALGYLEE